MMGGPTYNISREEMQRRHFEGERFLNRIPSPFGSDRSREIQRALALDVLGAIHGMRSKAGPAFFDELVRWELRERLPRALRVRLEDGTVLWERVS